MKETKFTDEQIVKILREAESGEQTIAAVCRAHGVHETTFYKWRRRFGGMEASDAKRLRELESENARLKRLLADRCMEVDAIKELLAKKW